MTKGEVYKSVCGQNIYKRWEKCGRSTSDILILLVFKRRMLWVGVIIITISIVYVSSI